MTLGAFSFNLSPGPWAVLDVIRSEDGPLRVGVGLRTPCPAAFAARDHWTPGGQSGIIGPGSGRTDRLIGGRCHVRAHGHGRVEAGDRRVHLRDVQPGPRLDLRWRRHGPGRGPPGYRGNARCVDPEEAFIASLSSCQMLTFLALAAKERYVVDSYRDQAVGVLGKDPSGSWAMTKVTLRPEVRFGGARTPGAEELRVWAVRR